jgi:hypothetical protein
MTKKGDGILTQAGTDRTESLIAAELDANALHDLWASSRFQPRANMNLGNVSPILAEFYQDKQTIEGAVEQHVRETGEAGLGWEPVPLEEPEEEVPPLPEAEEEVWETEPGAPESEPEEIEAEESGMPVADAMSLTEPPENENEDESAQ